jgi:hypothetical protein
MMHQQSNLFESHCGREYNIVHLNQSQKGVEDEFTLTVDFMYIGQDPSTRFLK